MASKLQKTIEALSTKHANTIFPISIILSSQEALGVLELLSYLMGVVDASGEQREEKAEKNS